MLLVFKVCRRTRRLLLTVIINKSEQARGSLELHTRRRYY